jgi:single-strand DNA-binding protein
MALPTISGSFGVSQEPDLRFSNDNKPWLKIRGVAKDRKYNSATKDWEDGDPCYIDIIVDGKTAENLYESVAIGDEIVVSGKLSQREWTGDDGKKQKAYTLRADTAGVSTRFSPAPSPKFRASAPEPAAVASSGEVSPF